MGHKIARRAAATVATVTIAVSGFLSTGDPASVAARPADDRAAAGSHAMRIDHSYGEDRDGRWDGGSQYSDGRSWYRYDQGLFYRWDGERWIARTTADAGFEHLLKYRYDDGYFYRWDGGRWIVGADADVDIAHSLPL